MMILRYTRMFLSGALPGRSAVKKIVAVITIAAFLSTSAGIDAAVAAATAAGPATAGRTKGFSLPSSAGRVTDISDAGSGTVVVAIQDLHCHPEVQRNIARIISQIDGKYGLNRVYVEGAYKDVDTSLLCGIRDDGLKRRVLERLVNDGVLTGGEYYSVTANRPRLLYGLENDELYRQNYARLAAILDRQDYYRELTAFLRGDLESAAKRYLGPANRRFEKLQLRYANGDMSAERYYALLKKYTEKLNAGTQPFPAHIDFASYRALSAYLKLADQGRRIRYAAVSRQLREFLVLLKQELPFSEYNALLEKTDNFAKLDELYAQLILLSRERRLDPGARFPDLEQFLVYLEKSRAIDPLALIREEKRLGEEIRAGLAGSINEMEVAFLSDYLNCFEDYLSNRLTPEDYACFVEKLPEFRRLWAKYNRVDRLQSLAGDFPLLDAYYRANVDRNAAFLETILGNAEVSAGKETAAPSSAGSPDDRAAALLNRAKNIVVVVTGGFHTPGLQQLLSERQISHLTVTPSVTSDARAANEVYVRLARRQAETLGRQAFALKSVFEAVRAEKPAPGQAPEQLITVATALLNVVVKENASDVKDSMEQLAASWNANNELKAAGWLSSTVDQNIVQLRLSPADGAPIVLTFKIGRGKDGIFLLPRSDTGTPEQAFLDRDKGYETFREVILAALDGQGGVASGDGDKMGKFKRLYGDPITDFLVDTALNILNEEALQYPGLALRFGGDESMGWVLNNSRKDLMEIFDAIRRAVFERMNRRYGVAELDANASDDQLRSLLEQKAVNVPVYGRSKDKYLVVFELSEGQTLSQALEKLNAACGLSMQLQDLSFQKEGKQYRTGGYLMVPTYSMGVVRLQDILKRFSRRERRQLLASSDGSTEDQNLYRRFFGMMQNAADHALYKAKEQRDNLELGRRPPSARRERSVYLQPGKRPDIPVVRIDKIPQRQSLHRNNNIRSVYEIRINYGSDRPDIVKAYEGLDDHEKKNPSKDALDQSGKKNSLEDLSFKTINALFGHTGGDEVIQLLFSAAQQYIKKAYPKGGIVLMRGAPDSIILATTRRENISPHEINRMLSRIHGLFSEYTRVTVKFSVYHALRDDAGRSRIFTRFVRNAGSVEKWTRLDECIKSFAETMEPLRKNRTVGIKYPPDIDYMKYNPEAYDGIIAEGLTDPKALKDILEVRSAEKLEASLVKVGEEAIADAQKTVGLLSDPAGNAAGSRLFKIIGSIFPAGKKAAATSIDLPSSRPALSYRNARLLSVFIAVVSGIASLKWGDVIGAAAVTLVIAAVTSAMIKDVYFSDAVSRPLSDTLKQVLPLAPSSTGKNYIIKRVKDLRRYQPCWYYLAPADWRTAPGVFDDLMAQNASDEMPAGLAVAVALPGEEIRAGRQPFDNGTMTVYPVEGSIAGVSGPCDLWLARITDGNRSAGVIIVQPRGRSTEDAAIPPAVALREVVRELNGDGVRTGNRELQASVVKRHLLNGKFGFRPEAVILRDESALRAGDLLSGQDERQVLNDAAFVLREQQGKPLNRDTLVMNARVVPDVIGASVAPDDALKGYGRAARRKNQNRNMKAQYLILSADAARLRLQDAHQLISIMKKVGALNIRLRNFEAENKEWSALARKARSSKVQLLCDMVVKKLDDGEIKTIQQRLGSGLSGIELDLTAFRDDELVTWLDELIKGIPFDSIITVRLDRMFRLKFERSLDRRLRIVTESDQTGAVRGGENECLLLNDPQNVTSIDATLAEVPFEKLDKDLGPGFVSNRGRLLLERCFRQFARLKDAFSENPVMTAWSYEEDELPELDVNAYMAALKANDPAAMVKFARDLAGDPAARQWNDLRKLLGSSNDAAGAVHAYLAAVAARQLLKERHISFEQLSANQLYGEMLLLEARYGKVSEEARAWESGSRDAADISRRISGLLPKARKGDLSAVAAVEVLLDALYERQVTIRKDGKYAPSIRAVSAMLGAA